ncbi:MAG: hypothetical protein QXR22_01265, partial [Acidilobaceae archaeon]
MDTNSAARIIISICNPVRGGSPGYTPYHVLEALKIIASKPIGRIQLSNLLGIGEASSKTLSYRLKSHNLVEPTRTGIKLTSKGLEVLEAITSSIIADNVNIPIEGWEESIMIQVTGLNPPKDLVEVYRIRDYIVREGCIEVVIGGYIGGSLKYPGMPEHIEKILNNSIPKEILREQTLNIVTPITCREQAISGIIKLLS